MIFSSEVFTHYSPLITDEQIHYCKKLLLFSFLSHLLVAGCDIGVRFSVRPSVSPYALTNVYLCVLKLWTPQCISMGFIL